MSAVPTTIPVKPLQATRTLERDCRSREVEPPYEEVADLISECFRRGITYVGDEWIVRRVEERGRSRPGAPVETEVALEALHTSGARWFVPVEYRTDGGEVRAPLDPEAQPLLAGRAGDDDAVEPPPLAVLVADLRAALAA